MHKILIIEDDKNILTGLVDNFQMEGYATAFARDGEDGLKQAKEKAFDLIILDVMLPKLNGLEVCKQIKAADISTPIIILSAKGNETDKVTGLELGADDYVTKPFSPRELLTRVRAVLRRANNPREARDIYEFDGVKIDLKRYKIVKGKKEETFTAAEAKILKLLIVSAGEPVSRHKLLAEVWSHEVTSRTVDTHIWSLREKIEDDPKNPKHIITAHRIGYKFVA